MHTHKTGSGHRAPGSTPVTLSDLAGLRMPWWTALTSTIAGWSRGPDHAVNRAVLAEAERTARTMSAGRRMGRILEVMALSGGLSRPSCGCRRKWKMLNAKAAW